MPQTDRDVIRALAARVMDLAQQPVMSERARLWTALHDLRGERPMVLFETWSLEAFVTDDELCCQDPLWRGVEHQLRWTIRHAEEVGDDLVIEPCWRLGWHITASGYGIDIQSVGAADSEGGKHAYAFNHPVHTPADLDALSPRTWQVDRTASQQYAERLSDCFGDLLPVLLHGSCTFLPGLSAEVFRLIGNDNLLTWLYDEPQALHRLMAFLRDDRLAMYAWLEREGLLGLNNNSIIAGSGNPGYTTALPQTGYAGTARLRDLWVWMESQETTMISPEMFGEFFLPYLAAVGNAFGLVYYGCCEPVHDRWTLLRQAMPNIRAVSISPWCDMPYMAQALGRDYVFSRKPQPAPISGVTPDWDTLRQDIDATLDAAHGCNLEIIFRDVYRIHGDWPRLRRWVEMVRARSTARV